MGETFRVSVGQFLNSSHRRMTDFSREMGDNLNFLQDFCNVVMVSLFRHGYAGFLKILHGITVIVNNLPES